MQRNTCVSILRSAALAFLGLALVGFAGRASAGENPAALQITIDNFSFAPATLTVPAGTEVTWVNHDDIPHTVVSEDKATFKSRALDTDEKFSFTFAKPGTYTYFCSIHPKMTAKVVVQ
ncbi:MAG TPA: cupredoxin family copper-binding protein [Terriglobales bacterium]|jgi:plastocyanin|nr:cupredoxin family copper-binding protein [Terriglobales bacterium]